MFQQSHFRVKDLEFPVNIQRERHDIKETVNITGKIISRNNLRRAAAQTDLERNQYRTIEDYKFGTLALH